MRLHLFKAIPFVLAASFVQAQTLPQAMQQALDVHPEIQAGVNSRIAADYQLRAAQGGYLPRVDLNAGYGRQGTDNATTRANNPGGNHWDTLNRGESSLRLQQMIFDGFATSSEVGRQQATVNSRAYSLLGTSERTALTVAQVYLDVLTRREFVRLAEQHGLPRVVSTQNPYCLVNRSYENALDETCDRLGVSLLAYSPLAFGLLTGKYDDGGIHTPASAEGHAGRPDRFASA